MSSPNTTPSPNPGSELYDKFFTHMFDACALHEILYDASGAPADYRFLGVNPAFERITGIPAHSVVGRTVREALPGVERYWIEAYGRVVQTGEPLLIEQHEKSLDKVFEVVAFRVADNQFACIFRDVTERKNGEERKARFSYMSELLSQVRQAIVRAESREQLVGSLSSVTRLGGHLRLHWLGQSEPASSSPSPWRCAVMDEAFHSKLPALGTPAASGCDRSGETGASCAAAPVCVQGEVWAMLCVDAPTGDFFGEPEVALLREAAEDLSLALDKLHAESRRLDAERQLRHEKEFIRTVLDNVAEGVIACDVQGQPALVNRSAMEWCAGHLPSAEPFTPFPGCESLLTSVLRGDALRNSPLSVPVPGGETRNLLANGTAFSDADGNRLGAVLALLDVTGQQTVERLLRESEERWQFALEGAGHGVWDANVSTGRSHYSRRWKAMLGYEDPEVGDTFEDWERLVHPFDLASVKAVMARHLAGETPSYGADFRMRCKDGSWRWIHGRGKVVSRDPDGRPLRVVGTHTDITERRRAEQKLRETEERFRLISENTGDVIWLVDAASLRITYISPSVQRMRGISPDEAMSQSLVQALTPKSFDYAMRQLQERVAALQAGDESARMRVDELEHYRRDGSIVQTEAVTTLLTDADGRVREVLGVSRDITERKAAEDALRASQAQLAETMELANLVPWRFDLATGRFIFNDRFYALCGTSAQDEGGYEMTPDCYARQFVHSEDMARVLTEAGGYRDQCCRGQRRQLEYRIVRRDGEVRYMVVRHEALFDESGSPAAIVGAHQDVTERRRAEEALRASEARFRTLISESPVAICMSRNGRVTYANPAFLKLTGYSSDEGLRGIRLPHLVAPESRKEAGNWFRLRSYGHEAAEKLEIAGLRAGGARYPLQVALSFMRFSDGPALVLFVEDLTAQRKAEAERERLQAQLLEAQKMESVGRLAGGVAHDFNNLLTVINGYSALILDRLPASDPVHSAAGHIQRAGERATSLVRQLLAFGRKQMLQPEVLDLTLVVRDTANMLPHLLNSAIEISLDRLGPVQPVLVDRQQLEQILVTLAINARDAMPQGGTLFFESSDVTLEVTGVPAAYVRLTVRDTGTGIDELTKAHLFEPFFTTKPFGQGSGLGLASVHGIVAQSGGVINVESEIGRGAAFHVCFPAVGSPAEAGAAADSSSAARGNETVLIAEDQEEVRRLVAAVLEGRGYTVLQAAAGQEALDICEARHLSLLISDIVMPGMNGFELARQARMIQPELKVLFMSGYSQPFRDPASEDEMGGASFIEKPFSPGGLAAKIREVLGVPAAKPKVLIVDDEHEVRQFLRKVMQSGGYDTYEAADGKQAIRHLRTNPVDLVVTDLVMPDMEGLATIRAVRHDYPHVGIIAISGVHGGQYLRMARPLGADAALRKPLEPETLLSEARRVLSLTR